MHAFEGMSVADNLLPNPRAAKHPDFVQDSSESILAVSLLIFGKDDRQEHSNSYPRRRQGVRDSSLPTLRRSQRVEWDYKRRKLLSAALS